MNPNIINTLSLAYLGDAVYEVLVRNYLLNSGMYNINELNKKQKEYVSASSQSEILDRLIKNNVLLDSELSLITRARNHKVNSKPRHVSVVTYKKATALEALFGILYIKNDTQRINEIFMKIVGE